MLEFSQIQDPVLNKPIIIAAMQDMGNVGSIVINFINEERKTRKFRVAKSTLPSYVVDEGGYVEVPNESWEYLYSDDLIIFGGGVGQPQGREELHALCQDVISIAKKYSVKLIYTCGGFHTSRIVSKSPQTFATSTSVQLTNQIRALGINTTPQKSLITGFNGLILGYAKLNDIQGIGLYGELNEPEIPQYRAALSIITTLEKLTYQKFGRLEKLEEMAREIEKRF